MTIKTKFNATILIFLVFFVKKGLSGCYFSVDFQGDFVTQIDSSLSGPATNLARDQLQYSKISIQTEGIPIWGKCYQKVGKNYILHDRVSQLNCFRCFRVNLRSSNVVELITHSLDRCFSSHSQALKACQNESDYTKLILFRDMENSIPGSSADVYCPINGEYDVTYSKPSLDGTSTNEACSKKSSLLTNCPEGNKLNLTLNGCRSNLVLRCLGDWSSNIFSERYVAFVDEKATKNDPKFRCGLYSKDAKTGRISLALSRDSTCSTDLYTSKLGYEIFELSPVPGPRLPSVVRKSSCSFPVWLQGAWEDMTVEGGSISYKDKTTFQFFDSDCVQQSFRHKDRFLIYSRSHCGEEFYNCVWFQTRTANVMELQFGSKPSTMPSFDLCDNNKFLQKTWNTQARRDQLERSACPVAGEYTGVLPDDSQFCAKLSSDCVNLDVVFYSVSSCNNSSELLEDREYQCLGQWEEDGLLYIYTRRKDFPGHECFVGSADDRNQLFLVEGRSNCKRGIAVSSYGMKLKEKSKCPGAPPSTNDKPWYVPKTKPNRPIFSINAEDLSTQSWQPMRGKDPFGNAASSYRQSKDYKFAFILLSIVLMTTLCV